MGIKGSTLNRAPYGYESILEGNRGGGGVYAGRMTRVLNRAFCVRSKVRGVLYRSVDALGSGLAVLLKVKGLFRRILLAVDWGLSSEVRVLHIYVWLVLCFLCAYCTEF